MQKNTKENNSVSIIMPVYNAGEHLQAAVQSILRQTHKNLELIIINDHSTDTAINHLDKTDSRLKIISNTGNGIVTALNSGIHHASKPFIARMDADDISLPTRLELQLNYLLANPNIEVCGTQIEMFSDSKKIEGGYQNYQRWINALTEPRSIANSIFIESPIPHPTVMMRKRHWLELGRYQDSNWPEDYDLWLRAHSKGFNFGKPEGVLLRWRDHDSRLSRISQRYDKKSFFRAKAFYLSKRYPDKNFRIWGSGPTGALLHDELVKNNGQITDFIDIAPNRIGNSKRNKPIVDAYKLTKTKDLILLAVSTRGARKDIRDYLNQQDFHEGLDYVCAA